MPVMQRELFSMFFLSSAVVTFGNACAFLTQFVLARMLLPADFSVMTALFALSITVIAPFSATPLLISHLMIRCRDNERQKADIVRRAYILALVVAGIFFVLMHKGSGLFERWLDLPGTLEPLLMPLLAVSVLLYHTPLGVWQGEQRYFMLSLGTAAIPILRFLAVMLLVVLGGGGIESAAIALALGGLVVFAFSIWDQRHALAVAPPGMHGMHTVYSGTAAFIGLASLTSIATLLLTSFDILIVRALAPGETAGYYAAASALAKIVLMLPQSVIGIVFAEAASLNQPGVAARAHSSLAWRSIGFTLLVSGAAALVLVAIPGFMLRLLAGPHYDGGAGILVLLAPAMVLLAVINLILTLALARRARLPLVLSFMTLLLLVGLSFGLQLDPAGVAALLLGLLGGLFLACMIWVVLSQRQDRSDPLT